MLPPERVRSLFTRARPRRRSWRSSRVSWGCMTAPTYDGETGSTAEVAKLLDAPVIAVLDASKMARSAGAVALGYQRFDEGLPLAGFIVNRVAGRRSWPRRCCRPLRGPRDFRSSAGCRAMKAARPGTAPRPDPDERAGPLGGVPPRCRRGRGSASRHRPPARHRPPGTARCPRSEEPNADKRRTVR